MTVPPSPSPDPDAPTAVLAPEPLSEVSSDAPPPPARERRFSRRDYLIIGALALLGVLVPVLITLPRLLATMDAVQGAQGTPSEVEYAVTRTSLAQPVTLTGTIQPTQRLDLSFTSEGEVTEVPVSVGDPVSPGSRLAAIDATELQAAVTDAAAEAEAARKDYNTARASGSSAEVTALRSAYNVKQQALKDAQAALDKATLVSTIDGVVAAVNVHVGDTAGSASSGAGGTGASAGADVVVISKTFQVDATVGASERTRVTKGMQATVTTATSSVPLSGTVTGLGVVAEAGSGGGDGSQASAAGFPVTVTIDGAPENVFAGSSATVDLLPADTGEAVLAVPMMALVDYDGGSAGHVNVRQGDELTTVAVTLGQPQGDMIEVLDGLSEGDVVVYTDYSSMMPPGGMGKPGDMGGAVATAEPSR